MWSAAPAVGSRDVAEHVRGGYNGNVPAARHLAISQGTGTGDDGLTRPSQAGVSYVVVLRAAIQLAARIVATHPEQLRQVSMPEPPVRACHGYSRDRTRGYRRQLNEKL